MENINDKSETIINLQKRGYDQDFVLTNGNFLWVQRGEVIPFDNLEVANTYCFQKKTKIKNQCVIYAIRAIHEDLKGILMTYDNSL